MYLNLHSFVYFDDTDVLDSDSEDNEDVEGGLSRHIRRCEGKDDNLSLHLYPLSYSKSLQLQQKNA
jgi:hypothetical protein